MENPKFEIFTGKNSEFFFRLRAKNGEPILASEGYTAKVNAFNGVDSVKQNSPNEDRYEKLKATSGEDYFVLKAPNGEIIGKSEMYSSSQAMENGIQAVKLNGPTANVEDTPE